MRHSFGIAAVMAAALAGLSAWTISHGGTNARVTTVHTISTAELTTQASTMPTQHFDAF